MTATLLDVNVLVALLWSDHNDHSAAQQWFRENEKKGWATCPFTQAAFVRIVSNPSFSPESVPPAEAVSLLEETVGRSTHEFWPDDLSLKQAVAYLKTELSGHNQITDAYLLGLAIHHQAKLVTFDKSLAALLPSGRRKSDWVIELSKRIH